MKDQQRGGASRGTLQFRKGGVIMDVVNAEQAKVAEDAGAVAVMALERVPADIRAAGGVARMADPRIIEEVIKRSPFLSWPRRGSDTLWKHACWKRWVLITSMRAKC